MLSKKSESAWTDCTATLADGLFTVSGDARITAIVVESVASVRGGGRGGPDKRANRFDVHFVGGSHACFSALSPSDKDAWLAALRSCLEAAAAAAAATGAVSAAAAPAVALVQPPPTSAEASATSAEAAAPAPAPADLRALTFDFELVQKYKSGEKKEPFVLNIFDCAGQRIFLEGMHSLFFTPDTIYFALFRLDELHDRKTRAACLAMLHKWLSMIYINAPDAPIVVVGTMKDKIPGDRRTLEQLSECIMERFEAHPAMWANHVDYATTSGVGTKEGQLCYFPVDNTLSDGAGRVDPVLAAARAVVEEAIENPSNAFMQRKVPFSWLELKDHMRVEAERQGGLKRTTRAQVLRWAIESGFGIVGGSSVEEQVDGFLQLMHAYGLVVWYNEPKLRSVVILDAQVRDRGCALGVCLRAFLDSLSAFLFLLSFFPFFLLLPP